MNLWHISNKYNKKEVNCIVEIPKGTRKKYELNKGSGKFILSRVIDTNFVYPLNYGFIPRTLASDNDPLDAIILGRKLERGSIVKARVIALLKMTDDHIIDDKILVIPNNEKKLLYIKDLKDVPKGVLIDIKFFFKHYKDREIKKTKVFKWMPCSKAHLEIQKSIKRYKRIKNAL